MSNDASEQKLCPKCQAPLPGDAPQGLCPKCLLAAASVPTEAGQPAGRPTPPSIGEIAAAFPQLEILEFIGQGGMGFVFKARQPKLDRLVALKILPQSLAADPTFAERFNREAKLLARLNHPGIVAVHDFGVASTQTPDAKLQSQFYYLLMEFVDGVNLRQAMQAGRFTPDQALAIVPKICDALQFAHNEGILHRDIKPENILLDAKGRVKIADFGIAKLVEGRAGSPLPAALDTTEDGAHGVTRPTQANLTEAGKTLGSPNYMAPEQLEHPGEVDHRADIYSLGVVFYEMLTGELPLGRFAPPSQKSAADPRVDEVVLRALEKERERRQHSAGEVKTQVETIAATSGSAGVPPAEPGVAPGRAERELKRGGIVLVGRRNGRRVIVWRGVANTFFAISGCILITSLLLRVIMPVSMEQMVAFMSLAVLVTAGGIIIGFWVPIEQLTSLDAFSPGGSSRGDEAQTEKSEIGNRKSEMSPRFSRTAIVGAAWLTLFFSVVPAFLWHEIQTHEPIRLNDPIWIIVVFALGLPGFTAPFGATILGWIAVSQIRHSAGKLYGLGLAVFDGLLFPLLALDGLVWGLWWLMLHASDKTVKIADGSYQRLEAPDGPVLLGTVLTCVVLDLLIVWWTWRTVNKCGSDVSPQIPAVGKPSNLKLTEPGTAKILLPALLTVAWHAVLLMATFGFFAVVVPRFSKEFANLGASLPPLTSLTITLSHAIQHGGWLLFPMLLVLDAGICILTQYLAGRWLRNVWSALVVCGCGVIVLVAGVSLYLPMSSLAQKVSPPTPAVAQNLSFGPVWPQDLTKNSLVDFESCLVSWSIPSFVLQPNTDGVIENFNSNLDWMWNQGIDFGFIEGRAICIGSNVVTLLPTDFTNISPKALVRQLAARGARDPAAVPVHFEPNVPSTFGFQTHQGSFGLLQLTGTTNNPGELKILYKLVQNDYASDFNFSFSAALLAEPPKLQFLAWQDKWQTSGSGAARHPDGSPVTDATELNWLHHNQPESSSDFSRLNLSPKPRQLDFWFWQPLFDQNTFTELVLLDDQNKVIPTISTESGTRITRDANGNVSPALWQYDVNIILEPTNLPPHITMQLHYCITGPLENSRDIQVQPSKSPRYTILQTNWQDLNIGQDVNGKAFITLGVDGGSMRDRRIGVVAVLTDGRMVAASSFGRPYTDAKINPETFIVNKPLADVAKFIIGMRPIHTVEWTNVVLPSN